MDATTTLAGVALGPLAWYCLVMGMTPGPNNLMLAASGMNFGLRRTLPHMLGVFVGFGALVMLAGLGIAGVYEAVPALQTALRWIGAAFLVYLAWRIAGASRTPHPEDARPLRFVEAAGFQFANPKAWLFSLTSATSFLAGTQASAALVLTAVALAVTVLSCLTWTLFGTAIARFIQSERVHRWINLAFAAALLALLPVILG